MHLGHPELEPWRHWYHYNTSAGGQADDDWPLRLHDVEAGCGWRDHRACPATACPG